MSAEHRLAQLVSGYTAYRQDKMRQHGRSELAKRKGTRFRCRAVVDRFGTKPAFRGPDVSAILLRDVVEVDTETSLTDHLWFTTGKWSAGLAVGDTFEFDARAADYVKGYQGRRDDVDAPISLDWKLARPTKVTIIRAAAE